MWWYWMVEHGLTMAFYAIMLAIVVVIAVGYALISRGWPGICFIWDFLTTVLYWPIDKLLNLLHVARADTEGEYERNMDERYP